MRSLNSGARKKPWRAAVNLAGKDHTHSCSRFPFLSFSVCCGSLFEDRSVRNGYCWAWLQRTRASSCHQDVAWCWCWEYARVEWAFRVVQSSQWNKEKTEMRKWWKTAIKTRPIMTARASSSNFERSCNSKLFQSWWSCQYRRLRCSADLAARGAAPFVLMKFNQWRQRLNFTVPSCTP